MSTKSFPHVIRRGDVYQFHRRVPQEVIDRPGAYQAIFSGRPFFRRSLRTKIYSDALKAAAELEEQFDQLVARALGRGSSLAPFGGKRELTAAELGKISSDICSEIVRDWRISILRANIDLDAREYLDRRIDQFIDHRDSSDVAAIALLGQNPVDRAVLINTQSGFFVAEKSNEFAELVAAVTDGCVAAQKAVSEMFAGNSLPQEPASTLIRSFAKSNRPKQGSKRFSEVCDVQMSVKKFAAKTRAKMRRSQALFVKLVGDKEVNDICKADVRNFLDHLSSQQVGTRTDLDRPISQTTMQSYLSGISSPLNFAASRGWLTEGNPALGMRIEDWRATPNSLKTPDRRRFSVQELNTLFEYPWFKGCVSDARCYEPGSLLLTDMRYWAPVLALYTGARAGELGGLRLEEIHLDDEAPHIWIKCNKYRNTKSKLDRHVPILDGLIQLGFVEYVRKLRTAGEDRVFPDWKLPLKDDVNDAHYNWANTKWIRAFNRTVIPSALPNSVTSGSRSPVVFHSLRGAFKFMLLEHGSPHLANAILGHSQDDYDRAYIGSVSPKETYAAFHYANFNGLVIPARK
jgi:integrase